MATKGGPIRGQDLVAVRGTCRPKDGQNLAQFPDPVPQHLPLSRRRNDKQLPDLPMSGSFVKGHETGRKPFRVVPRSWQATHNLGVSLWTWTRGVEVIT